VESLIKDGDHSYKRIASIVPKPMFC